MRFFQITTKAETVKYRLFGVPFFRITRRPEQIVLHFPAFKIRINRYPVPRAEMKDFLQAAAAAATTAVIDTAWGGGTAHYSRTSLLPELQSRNPQPLILRILNFGRRNGYRVIGSGAFNGAIHFYSLSRLEKFLEQLSPREIILNSPAGYPDIPGILAMLRRLKQKTACRISSRGHDYLPLCPIYTLTGTGGGYCGLPPEAECDVCFRENRFRRKEMKPYRRLTGIRQYRKIWENFFRETLDEIIVFCDDSRKRFCRIHPVLNGKTRTIPHFVPPLRKAAVAPHDGIRIGVIGKISSPAKGTAILAGLERRLELAENSDISLAVLGEYAATSARTKVTGSYRREELPSLAENLQIDIVLFPSTSPETFSYVVAEVQNMGLPCACLDLGAPAERLRQYPSGLILPNPDPAAILKTIRAFLAAPSEKDA